MWYFLFYCTTLFFGAAYVMGIRRLVLAALERVRTREPRTLAEMEYIVRLLQGDPEKVSLVTTKDRTSPGGRRGAVRAAKARVFEDQRKRDALETIRRRMGHKLTERKKATNTTNATKEDGVRLWDYFSWNAS